MMTVTNSEINFVMIFHLFKLAITKLIVSCGATNIFSRKVYNFVLSIIQYFKAFTLIITCIYFEGVLKFLALAAPPSF